MSDVLDGPCNFCHQRSRFLETVPGGWYVCTTCKVNFDRTATVAGLATAPLTTAVLALVRTMTQHHTKGA